MAMAMLQLRKAPGINRPAIAVLWPANNSRGFNIVLDAGADIKADSDDLLQYALMGVTYARDGFDIQRPKVGLLNVGTEIFQINKKKITLTTWVIWKEAIYPQQRQT